MIAEKKEAYPLSWPEDWPRTRPQDQREMRSWKKTANQYPQLIFKLNKAGLIDKNGTKFSLKQL